MSVSLKKGSTMIVIMLTLLTCFLMGCSISHLPDHPAFPIPAQISNEQLVFWSADHEHLPNITVIDY